MTQRFQISTHDNGYYCVSIPGYEGGDVVSATDYDALLSEVAQLRALLNPIIDCYGLGLSVEKFAKQVGPFIMDARAALAGKEKVSGDGK